MAQMVIDTFLPELFECDALELFAPLRGACKHFRQILPEYDNHLGRILCTCRHLRSIEAYPHATVELRRRLLEIRILIWWIGYNTGSVWLLAACASLIDRLVAGSGSHPVFLEGAQLLKDLGIKAPSVRLLTLARHSDVRRLVVDGFARDMHQSQSFRVCLLLTYVRFFQLIGRRRRFWALLQGGVALELRLRPRLLVS